MIKHKPLRRAISLVLTLALALSLAAIAPATAVGLMIREPAKSVDKKKQSSGRKE
jgi:hypothetical protein